MGRDRKRRRRRRESDDDAPREGRRSPPPAPAAPGTKWVGELIRYAIVCAVLLSVATPLGVAVAFFWGLSLLRRFRASGAPGGWLPQPPAGEWLPVPEKAPQLATVELAEILEREWAARAARFAGRGVEIFRELDGEGALRGDAERLGFAIGDLLDAALAELEGGEKPLLRLELGENLAGSEVWLRLRGTPGGPAPRRATEPSSLWVPELGGADRVVRAHGGRLETFSGGGGFELLVTLPKAGFDRP
jgi:signal transduction histidine kinase